MNPEELKKDPVIKSIFDEGGMEQPSGKFTSTILKNIKAQSENSVYKYQPVISKSAWLVIAAIGLAFFIYLSFAMTPEGTGIELYGYALKFDTSFLKTFFSKIALSFTLSPILKTSLMALIFSTFFHLIIFELRSRSFFK